MGAFFSLATASDLREKLRRDHDLLKADPLNSDLMFDFFVTAWHIFDWLDPNVFGDVKAHRRNERNNNVILQVCDHIANGAKHFTLDPARHSSVTGTVQNKGWMSPWFLMGNPWFGSGPLVVLLDGDAKNQLGHAISAIELADRIMNYWNSRQV